MPQDTHSFRSQVLGFDRNDVINYIETISREHQEEIAAFRAAADVLRRERDKALKELEERDARMSGLAESNEAAEKLSKELQAKNAAYDTLFLRNAELADSLKAAQDEAAALKTQNEEILKQSEMLGKAKMRAADMELMAYKRAQEIETEALQNAEKARATLQRLIRDTKGKYSASKGEVESVAYAVLAELTRMRDWFDDFPHVFDEIDDLLDSIVPPEGRTSPAPVKPVIAPREIAQPETKPGQGVVSEPVFREFYGDRHESASYGDPILYGQPRPDTGANQNKTREPERFVPFSSDTE